MAPVRLLSDVIADVKSRAKPRVPEIPQAVNKRAAEWRNCLTLREYWSLRQAEHSSICACPGDDIDAAIIVCYDVGLDLSVELGIYEI